MQRSDLFNLNYYRQADFTGSRGDICYHLSLAEAGPADQAASDGTEGGDPVGVGAEEGAGSCFRLQWWKGPFAAGTTEEEKEEKYFPYTNEGLDQIVDFLNKMEVRPMRGNLFEDVMRRREAEK